MHLIAASQTTAYRRLMHIKAEKSQKKKKIELNVFIAKVLNSCNLLTRQNPTAPVLNC